jgi:hypothetical protein
VKGKIPVFWIEGLGVERDGKTITPLFFEKVMPPAARARRQTLHAAAYRVSFFASLPMNRAVPAGDGRAILQEAQQT